MVLAIACSLGVLSAGRGIRRILAKRKGPETGSEPDDPGFLTEFGVMSLVIVGAVVAGGLLGLRDGDLAIYVVAVGIASRGIPFGIGQG